MMEKFLEAFAIRAEIGPDQYQCANCGGVFDKGWSEEEAAAERTANGWTEEEASAVVCDECYKMIMRDVRGSDGEDS